MVCFCFHSSILINRPLCIWLLSEYNEYDDGKADARFCDNIDNLKLFVIQVKLPSLIS